MPTLRGHHTIVAVGAATFLAAAGHHGSELEALSNVAGPLVALTVDGGIAIDVVYDGRRIGAAEFSPGEEWQIAHWTLAGTISRSLRSVDARGAQIRGATAR